MGIDRVIVAGRQDGYTPKSSLYRGWGGYHGGWDNHHTPLEKEYQSIYHRLYDLYRKVGSITVTSCLIPIPKSQAHIRASRSPFASDVILLEVVWPWHVQNVLYQRSYASNRENTQCVFDKMLYQHLEFKFDYVDPFVTVDFLEGPQKREDTVSPLDASRQFRFIKIRLGYEGETADKWIHVPEPVGGDMVFQGGTKVCVEAQVMDYTYSHTYDVSDVFSLNQLLRWSQGDTHKLWSLFLGGSGKGWDNRDSGGVKKLESSSPHKEALAKLGEVDPLMLDFLGFLHSKAVVDKISNNKIIESILLRCAGDYDALYAAVKGLMDVLSNTSIDIWQDAKFPKEILLNSEVAQDVISEKESKIRWQFSKTQEAKAVTLGITEDRHPNLNRMVKDGSIPLGIFHMAGQEDNLINVEFDLIEQALSRPGWAEVLAEIFQNAASRTTYTRRVTNYLAFLFRIEKYLDRHAPRPKAGRKMVGWRAFPKFVQSQWELEMNDEATAEGTTKRRSAMTPIVDNDAGTIHVPYVAMAVHGAYTTWCYSDTYFVAEEGQEDPVGEGVYSKDLEIKLNGRDDYGLMLFTLTGTSRNAGYPTFLIIFERTKGNTTVHFHRVHPCRARGPNGTPTPPSRLIDECYRYMAGNVKASEIAFQQGDLMLTPCEQPGQKSDEPARVVSFENHSFVSNGVNPVFFHKNPKFGTGNNILGWLSTQDGMNMPHPEHEDVVGIPPGCYILRRAKSYENNPVGVWSLNID